MTKLIRFALLSTLLLIPLWFSFRDSPSVSDELIDHSLIKGTDALGNPGAVSLYEVNMLHLKYSEGLRLNAYRCPAGVKTIGWGATRTDQDEITYKEANAWTAEEFERLYNDLRITYPHLSRQQVLALTSFSYNVKIGKNLHKALMQDDTAKVIAYMRSYVYGGGRILDGLIQRRVREAILYAGDYDDLARLRDRLKPAVRQKISNAIKK